jgi:hypothetical protein
VNHSFDHGNNSDTHFDSQGSWSLLLFADPGCVSCQTAVSALERLAPSLREMRILVATTAEPNVIAAVEQFQDASVLISRVAWEVPSKMYRTLTTPFAYVIDPQGIIKAKGIAGDASEIRKIVQKADQHSRIRVVSSFPFSKCATFHPDSSHSWLLSDFPSRGIKDSHRE